jgi:hypothetical protein
MSYAPMHYRKQPIYEDGDYSQLSIYVRGLGEMIRKFCNDQGVFALGGRSPAEAVAHKIGAHRGDRRSLAADIDTLVRSGFLRLAPNAIVVVQQEEFWSELNTTRSPRSAREPNATRTSPARDANTNGTLTAHDADTSGALPAHDVYSKDEPSAGNHSADTVASDQIIRDKSEEINKIRPSPVGEGVQGEHNSNLPQKPEKPVNVLQAQQLPAEVIALDAAVGKGPAAWGMDGSSITLEVDTSCAQGPEQQTHPTPRPAPPSPPAARPAPSATVVDPKPVPNPDPPALALTPSPQAAKSPKGKAKPKSAALPPEQRVIALSPAEQAAVSAIRNDPDLARICKNVEQLAVDLVNCAPLVDVALEIRGLGAYLRTDKGRAKRYTDGNGYLLNNIGRKQNEQRERQASMPQYVAPPPEPKRPVPPPPPPHPMVQAAIDRRMASDEPIDLLSLCKRVGNPFRDLDESQVAL